MTNTALGKVSPHISFVRPVYENSTASIVSQIILQKAGLYRQFRYFMQLLPKQTVSNT